MQINDIKQLKYAVMPDGSTYSRLTQAIKPGKIISIVGGGGKTSTMVTLGKELADQGKSVIITTSTKIREFTGDFPEGLRCVGIPMGNGKLKGIDNPDALIDQCDYLIIEADGSKGLPLKMPADHEPVISCRSDMVIALVGMSCMGNTIETCCHRPELVCHFLQKRKEDIITPQDIARIIQSPQGLRKDVGEREFIVIFNQADSDSHIAFAREIASYLPDDYAYTITSYEQ